MDLLPLRTALEALNSEVEQAEAELAAAEAQLKECEQRVMMLQAERSGIESYIRRHESGETPRTVTSGEEVARGWASMPRTEAVAQVLADAGEPMTPGAIQEALGQVGRVDEYRDVAAALSHLKSRGRAVNVARGVWALSEISEAAEGFDPDHEPLEPEDAGYDPPFHDEGYLDALAEDEPPEDPDEHLDE